MAPESATPPTPDALPDERIDDMTNDEAAAEIAQRDADALATYGDDRLDDADEEADESRRQGWSTVLGATCSQTSAPPEPSVSTPAARPQSPAVNQAPPPPRPQTRAEAYVAALLAHVRRRR